MIEIFIKIDFFTGAKLPKIEKKPKIFIEKNTFFTQKMAKKIGDFCGNHNILRNNELPIKNVLTVIKNVSKFTIIVPVVTKVVHAIITRWLTDIVILQRQNSPNGALRQTRELDFRFLERIKKNRN